MNQRKTKSEMVSLSKRYLPDEELRNPMAKLFRGLLNKLQMNPTKWTSLLHDYLSWVISGETLENRRKIALMKTGNIRDAFFHNPKLTADKLFEGLSILQIEECEIILRVKDRKGEVYEIIENVPIKHAKNTEVYEETET